MLSAFTHFFPINFNTELVLLIWSPQIWRSDYNSYVWCMEWWFKRAAMFHCDFKLHPKAFLYIQENFIDISFLPRILFCGLHSECPKSHLHISRILNILYLWWLSALIFSLTFSLAQEMINVPHLSNFIIRESGQWRTAQKKKREEGIDDLGLSV